MRRFFVSIVAGLGLGSAVPAAAEPAAPLVAAGEVDARDSLVAAVDIPYEKFVLDNGLTTIVHTDRKAPIVGVTLYYRIGSKHEPRGRTGFAHLYEHLFFGGSANVENFDKPLTAAGASTTNGSTWYDRTNYVETLPTGALELALFMESDRMGYLLPAVTQDKLDKQRNVVQNEKRQGDNQPYGLLDYAVNEGLFPVGHPYRHSTIGSMADLQAATLLDVRNWFRDNYGPNNVVLVLTGDIDAAAARPLVERWFGAIPSGPAVEPVKAGPVTLSAPKAREISDQVPVVRLTRNWSGPGLNHPDVPALYIGMHILGGLAGSRLDNALVRGEELAVSVVASADAFEQVGFLQVSMDVKPGVEQTRAEARLAEVIAHYIAEGPTQDELRRAVTSTLSGQIGALERVGGFAGKGATLAEGELYSNDPAKYRRDLEAMAALTPAAVQAALQRWLLRPVYALNVVPGERTLSGNEMGGWGDEADQPPPPPDVRSPAPPLPPAPERSAPPVPPVGELDFPEIERAELSNGIPVVLAHRASVPKAIVSLGFDAGIAADAHERPGTQALMLDMLDEGTTSLSATQIAEAQERLGASIATGASIDASSVNLSTLTATLEPSLQLMAQIARQPAFAPDEVARVKNRRIAELSHTLSSPRALAARELGLLIFAGHPYAQPADGLGDRASLETLTPADLRAAHNRWLRPDLARITVVGDVTMDRLLPMLETAFGNWRNPGEPAPTKDLSGALTTQKERIVLIDRPNSPQSVIMAGQVLPVTGRERDMEALDLANEVIGGDFLSRLNSDLREEKGWSYGVYSGVAQPVGPRSFSVAAPVQADRTGDAIAAILENLKAFPASQPVSKEELQRVTEGAIRALPLAFETNSDVLGAIVANERLGRPDSYYETLAQTYRAIGAPQIEQAAGRFLQPEGLVIVVVGERETVEPQLRKLGMPLEIRKVEEEPAEAG